MTEEDLPKKGQPRPRAPFVAVKCPDCSQEQIVFSRPSTSVNCTTCGALLASPSGGKGNFRATIVRAEA